MIPEDAAKQRVPLTGITSGAANENQFLTVTVAEVTGNAELITDPVIVYTSRTWHDL